MADLAIHRVRSLLVIPLDHFPATDDREEFWTRKFHVTDDLGMHEITLYGYYPAALLLPGETLPAAEIVAPAEPEQVQCRNCENGRWETECCSGDGGCSCKGERIDMGTCNVCHGTGFHAPDANTKANCDAIRGMPFIGSGPTSGLWAGGRLNV